MLFRPENLPPIMAESKKCMEGDGPYDAGGSYVELSGALIKREFRKQDDVKRGAVLRMFWLLKFGYEAPVPYVRWIADDWNQRSVSSFSRKIPFVREVGLVEIKSDQHLPTPASRVLCFEAGVGRCPWWLLRVVVAVLYGFVLPLHKKLARFFDRKGDSSSVVGEKREGKTDGVSVPSKHDPNTETTSSSSSLLQPQAPAPAPAPAPAAASISRTTTEGGPVMMILFPLALSVFLTWLVVRGQGSTSSSGHVSNKNPLDFLQDPFFVQGMGVTGLAYVTMATACYASDSW